MCRGLVLEKFMAFHIVHFYSLFIFLLNFFLLFLFISISFCVCVYMSSGAAFVIHYRSREQFASQRQKQPAK